MTLAAIDWLSITINLLLVVFVIVCLLMTLLILMQRPKQEGLGAAFGGGVTDQVFGARTTNVLQRGTVYLGSLFFLISLALAVLIGHQNKDISLAADKKEAKVEESKTDDAAPAGDLEAQPKSLLDELPADTPPVEDAPAEAPPAEAPPADAPSSEAPPAEAPPAEAPPAEAPPAEAPPAEAPPAEAPPAEAPPADAPPAEAPPAGEPSSEPPAEEAPKSDEASGQP